MTVPATCKAEIDKRATAPINRPISSSPEISKNSPTGVAGIDGRNATTAGAMASVSRMAMARRILVAIYISPNPGMIIRAAPSRTKTINTPKISAGSSSASIRLP